MSKIILIGCVLLMCGCSHKKPELVTTQIVEGKSIIIPPEFDIIPESAAPEEE